MIEYLVGLCERLREHLIITSAPQLIYACHHIVVTPLICSLSMKAVWSPLMAQHWVDWTLFLDTSLKAYLSTISASLSDEVYLLYCSFMFFQLCLGFLQSARLWFMVKKRKETELAIGSQKAVVIMDNRLALCITMRETCCKTFQRVVL